MPTGVYKRKNEDLRRLKDMTWIVGGFTSYFEDDVEEECCKCKKKIYFRPYVDITNKKKLICIECVSKEINIDVVYQTEKYHIICRICKECKTCGDCICDENA